MVDFEFASYMAKHGKVYRDIEEYEKRKALFSEMDQFIRTQNSNSRKGAKLGHNKFSDMTKSERAAKAGLKASPKRDSFVAQERILSANGDTTTYTMGLSDDKLDFNNASSSTAGNGKIVSLDGDFPDEKDWRTDKAIRDVQDQAECSASWAFVATDLLGSAYKISKGILNDFTPSSLLTAARDYGANNCGGGYIYSGFQYYLDDDNNKPVISDDYPYTAILGTCSQDSYKRPDVQVDEWDYVQPYDGDQLKRAINVAPIGVGVNADCLVFQQYENGVFDGTWTEIDEEGAEVLMECANEQSDLTHTAVLVGYGTENSVDSVSKYFILKNSWGTDWGEDGYMRVKNTGTGNGVVGINTLAITVKSGALSTLTTITGFLAAFAAIFAF
eukprot:CAMPEP_0170471516 /NCGR_PEP_ID=MMETSP0123-20130129/13714_1 /TAXON_ID=182087 /ORGANISM="Favella ehrenbergii, Strain Fehren 1" /LENGTH=386 /DNA_ID=CAMNT_0010739199 /DNA_START=89 /DNA_END=1249 /DNA_ORIENTATION=-